VVNHIFSEQLPFETEEELRQKIMTAGRGEIEANQEIDDPTDRRVTFRFQFRGEDFADLSTRWSEENDESNP
jgi:hypothetical protein